MGIETPTEYSGSGCGFLTMMLVVEELSRVDPAVAAYVDIHNTLVNSLFMKLGTEEQKKKYLTKLCTEYVSDYYLTMTSSTFIQKLYILYTSDVNAKFSLGKEKHYTVLRYSCNIMYI